MATKESENKYALHGRGGEKSRIDYYLIPKAIDNQVDALDIKAAPFSDHSVIFNPRSLRPKGYCHHPRLSVCPSVCLFPSSLLTQ